MEDAKIWTDDFNIRSVFIKGAPQKGAGNIISNCKISEDCSSALLVHSLQKSRRVALPVELLNLPRPG